MILMLLMQDGFKSDIHIIERIHTSLLWLALLNSPNANSVSRSPKPY